MIDPGNKPGDLECPGGMVPTARPNPSDLVLDLARTLAEEFDTVPLPLVSRAVKAAAEAISLFGEDVMTALATIEQIARQDLLALRDATDRPLPV